MRLPLTVVSLLLVPLLAFAADPPVVAAPARHLDAELAGLATDKLFKKADVAIQVVNVRTGEEVYAWDADRALIPASTMKALTAATALRTLGPSFKFNTSLYRDGEIDSAGVLKGNLYVKGHGDPTFVIERLWKVVYDLKIEGVTRIAGDVIYDEGYFDTSYQLPGWDKEEDIERGPSYFPPASALSLNHNAVTLVVSPGPEVGASAVVRLETPAGGYITLESTVKTGAVGSWSKVEIERTVEADTMTFEIEGTVPLDGGARRYYRSVAEPTAHFAAAFKEMLASQGVTVTGGHKRGSTPARAEQILSVQSTGLTAILMDMNKYSNNFIAEQVLKTIGAEVYGVPGTTEKGLMAVREYLVSLGVDPGTFKLVNGSGLARGSKIPPSVFTAVYVDMAHDTKIGHEFAASLAIGGVDGTLWSRFRKEPNRLRGKTGTIDGTHCLTGYIRGGDEEMYAFAILVNNTPAISQVKDLHDRFAREIFSLEGEVTHLVDAARTDAATAP